MAEIVHQAPSALHCFGTDDLGRDIFSRVIFGARASLLVGIVSVVIAMVTGVPLGLISGNFGGWVDVVISRCTDALLSCPFLVLAIAFAAFLGASLQNAMIAIGISAMPIFVRLTRGQVMMVKTEDYIAAARLLGVPNLKIMTVYVLPNILAPIVVQSTITMATAVLAKNQIDGRQLLVTRAGIAGSFVIRRASVPMLLQGGYGNGNIFTTMHRSSVRASASTGSSIFWKTPSAAIRSAIGRPVQSTTMGSRPGERPTGKTIKQIGAPYFLAR
jgi:hypothetical protein